MFISTHLLHKNLSNKNLVIIDASWYLPYENRNTFFEYKKRHIPGTFFFDIEKISDKRSNLPHMLPSKQIFLREIRKFGIRKNSKIIIYDTKGIFSSTRLWWMFKFFGVKKVFILEGGFPKWRKEGRPISDRVSFNKKGSINLNVNNAVLATMDKVIKSIRYKKHQILDVRSEDRFLGKVEEPRKNLRKGKIPQSLNIFYEDFLVKNKTFKNKKEIKSIFQKNKINLEKHVIVSCGSGITAAIVFIAFHLIGIKNVSLYDGSWTEWGSYSEKEIEKFINA